jgi:hypothetical protein
MRLLTGLAEAGAVLLVRADDGPAGQEIVSGIMKAIPGARLWRFALRDPVTPRYEEQDIEVLLRDLRGNGIRTRREGESGRPYLAAYRPGRSRELPTKFRPV